MKKKNLHTDRINLGLSILIVALLFSIGLTFCSNGNDLILSEENIPQDIASTEEYYQDLGYTTENFDGFLIVRKGQGID